MKNSKPQPLTAPPKKVKGLPKKPMTGTELETLSPDSQEVTSARNLKEQLTTKELKFIEIYLSGDINMDEAMIAAGYIGYHKKSLYRLGKKIIEKFETRAGDRRKIARAMGVGEVTILEGFRDIAQNPKEPAAVRLRAWEALASCIGLKSEIVEPLKGVQIIINTGPRAQAAAGEVRPGTEGNPPIPRKPKQITPPEPLQITE